MKSVVLSPLSAVRPHKTKTMIQASFSFSIQTAAPPGLQSSQLYTDIDYARWKWHQQQMSLHKKPLTSAVLTDSHLVSRW